MLLYFPRYFPLFMYMGAGQVLSSPHLLAEPSGTILGSSSPTPSCSVSKVRKAQWMIIITDVLLDESILDILFHSKYRHDSFTAINCVISKLGRKLVKSKFKSANFIGSSSCTFRQAYLVWIVVIILTIIIFLFGINTYCGR